MVTEEDVRGSIQEALPETSAKEAEISFIVNQSSDWIIVLRSGKEEVAVRVAATPDSTPDSLRQEFIQEVAKLF